MRGAEALLAPSLPLILALTMGSGGCGLPDAGEVGDRGEGVHAIRVDSIFPITEELRRFREGMDTLESFQGGGAPTRDLLVERLIGGLERADTAAVLALAMNRVEFAWLYYPHTRYTRPPYELSPALVWYQQQNRSSRGLARLLARYAGEKLHYAGHACPAAGEPFGEGRIWHGCTVLGRLPSGEPVSERLFGSILGVRGRYKFVSWSNAL